ncbi:MAG: SPOR domain-containing protein [Bacteroidia bacterium]|nr:SPOR domain-containing protein [Bacteroidia bacterium]
MHLFRKPKAIAVSKSRQMPETKKYITFFFLWLLLSLATLSMAQNTSYHLIAGSFKTLKPANELVDVLSMKGFSPQIIFPSEKSSYYRVSIFNSVDRNTVKSYKSQVSGGAKYWTLAVDGTQSRSSVSGNPSFENDRSIFSNNYHVVIGSFPSRDAALRSQGARQNQGFNAYILEPADGNSTYRLAVYRSSNRKEVETYQRQLVRSGKVPNAWIHESGASTSVSTGTGSRVVGGMYHLIGGSYNKFDEADAYKQEMIGKGFKAIIIFPKPGVSTTYRVSVARSAVKNDVKSAQAKYKSMTKKGSWIYFEK